MEVKNLTSTFGEGNTKTIYAINSKNTFLNFFAFLVSLRFAVLPLLLVVIYYRLLCTRSTKHKQKYNGARQR